MGIALEVIEEVREQQRKKLYDCAKEFIPNITYEDILQPNDYPELENNPLFRYEEGILEGIMTVEAALRAKNATIPCL